jgi:hypothetical protein
MTIEPINIHSGAQAITGQMGHIVFALEALRQDAKVPPLNRLKPGQLHKRIDDYLRAQGFNQRELPSRSTFDRFRRQFGATFGVR